MSQRKTYPIRCPKCGHEQEVELYESVNVAESPELKEDLLLNRLNAVQCPQCEFAFRVDAPLLYCNPAVGYMIYWMPMPEDQLEEAVRRFRDVMEVIQGTLPDDFRVPEVSMVLTRTELVERIYLLDKDLEERIIEYIKYMIYSNNLSRLDPASHTILFNAQDSNQEQLCFVVQDLQSGQFQSMLRYETKAYEGMKEMFGQPEQAERLLELFPGPYISARRMLLEDAEDPPASMSGPELV
jgi:hypothetical protein